MERCRCRHPFTCRSQPDTQLRALPRAARGRRRHNVGQLPAHQKTCRPGARPRPAATRDRRMQRGRPRQPPFPFGRTRHHRLQLPRQLVCRRPAELPRQTVCHHRKRIGTDDPRFLHDAVRPVLYLARQLGSSVLPRLNVMLLLRQLLRALGQLSRRDDETCARQRLHFRPVRMDGIRLSRRTHPLPVAGAQQLFRHNRPRRIPQGHLLPLPKRVAERHRRAPHLPPLELDRG